MSADREITPSVMEDQRVVAHFDNVSQNPLLYNAYLVRLWQDTPGTEWRASAQSVRSGETVRFGTLRALFAFLERQTTHAGQANAPTTDEDVAQEP